MECKAEGEPFRLDKPRRAFECRVEGWAMVRLMEMGRGPFQTEAVAETKVWGQDSHGWLWEMLTVPLATGLGE